MHDEINRLIECMNGNEYFSACVNEACEKKLKKLNHKK